MVKYTLGDKVKQIFASKYQFHLPTEKELEVELKREIEAIQSLKNENQRPRKICHALRGDFKPLHAGPIVKL